MLWVLGLAITLAALSYSDYLASCRRVRTRRILGSSTFQLPFSAGMTLVCLGLLFTTQKAWERVVWGILSVLFVIQAGALLRRRPTSQQPKTQPEITSNPPMGQDKPYPDSPEEKS